jgi:hypothetical protein
MYLGLGRFVIMGFELLVIRPPERGRPRVTDAMLRGLGRVSVPFRLVKTGNYHVPRRPKGLGVPSDGEHVYGAFVRGDACPVPSFWYFFGWNATGESYESITALLLWLLW